MLILWEHFKTKIKNIGQIERMLHCIKIDKLKKMTLHMMPLHVLYFWGILGHFFGAFSPEWGASLGPPQTDGSAAIRNTRPTRGEMREKTRETHAQHAGK